jgi:HSP20 family protein
MSTLNQLREGLNEVWDTLVEGWHRLYRRASGAITRFTPGKTPGESAGEGGQENTLRSAGWGVLAAEVFDNDDKIVVRLEAPGLEKDDFALQVVDGYLVVRGEKQVERQRSEGYYYVTECAYGRFERAIPLPDEVQADKAHASYKNGVLRVEFPRSKPVHRRKISVK